MARFVLQRCKVRLDRAVLLKDEPPCELDWGGLVQRFAPGGRIDARVNMRNNLRVGGFVGLIKRRGKEEVANFVLFHPARNGNLGWVLRADPTFSERVVEIHKVSEIEWDHKFQEGLPQ